MSEPGSRYGTAQAPPDAELRIRTSNRAFRVAVRVARSHLTRTVADGLLARQDIQSTDPYWMLFAPHVGRGLGAYLKEMGANYIDRAGNCHLILGEGLMAHVEGRPPERRPREGRSIGVPGYRVLFSILVQPDLLNSPVRGLASAASVSPATAANTRAQLEHEGLVHKSAQGWRVTHPRGVLEKWLRGYETTVRPKLVIGRYRVETSDPEELERRIGSIFKGASEPWALGGTAAAFRMTGHYRGEETVLHLIKQSSEAVRQLRAISATDGPLILLNVPSSLAFVSPVPDTVTPLLVYSELLHEGSRRSLESAEEVASRYLTHVFE
ncbi:MAG: hypothetical protein KDA27_23560 [Candidatus Eisenbacteria bacterium]|uniref:Uncharacterized protein n=1 Tax=Eiseniibacteriota bacterium TaxID=2212470 RepID=A0A956NHQ9_UNCEI|nr:hypothetical protein [Candidatus Eisenbacteria bacterium]